MLMRSFYRVRMCMCVIIIFALLSAFGQEFSIVQLINPPSPGAPARRPQCARSKHAGAEAPLVPHAACAAAAAQAASGASLMLGFVCVWVLLECTFPGCFPPRRRISAVELGAKCAGDSHTRFAPMSGLEIQRLECKHPQKHAF